MGECAGMFLETATLTSAFSGTHDCIDPPRARNALQFVLSAIVELRLSPVCAWLSLVPHPVGHVLADHVL